MAANLRDLLRGRPDRKGFLAMLGRRRVQLAVFVGILGPGLITSTADNDAGGIFTWASAGARYGYDLIWLLVVVTVALMVVQEFNARLGVVTGKGLADLIRERFGVRITVLAMALLLVANVATVIAEFAGIALAGEAFNVSRYITVPLAALVVWFLVLRGSYAVVEKVFLAFALVYLTYVVSGVLVHPPWGDVLHHTVTPTIHLNSEYLLLAVAIVGTTITPWMQFYLQASVVDKGTAGGGHQLRAGGRLRGLVVHGRHRLLHRRRHRRHAVRRRAPQHRQREGRGRGAGAGCGQVRRGAVRRRPGRGVDAGRRDPAPVHGIRHHGGVRLGAGRRLLGARGPRVLHHLHRRHPGRGRHDPLPGVPLTAVTLLSQDVNGLILPAILVFMLILVNDRRVMGRFVNGRFANAVGGLTIGGVIVLTGLLLLSGLPGFPWVHLGG